MLDWGRCIGARTFSTSGVAHLLAALLPVAGLEGPSAPLELPGHIWFAVTANRGVVCSAETSRTDGEEQVGHRCPGGFQA
jgi:hypothetical protein